jgi:Family of unknown function (DUF6325)
MGPLEVVAIAFPGPRFEGEIMPALAAAAEHGALRIIDLTFIRKDAAGRVTSYELAELDERETVPFDVVDEITGLLSVDDIDQIGAGLAADSSAAVLVFEHAWAADLEGATLGAGGRLVAHRRIPDEVAHDALAEAGAGAGPDRRPWPMFGRSLRHGPGLLRAMAPADSAATPTPGPAAATVGGLTAAQCSQLACLARLRAQGILTEAEVSAATTRILAR